MKNVDFSECEFINDYLKFYTFEDFCNSCQTIKSCFEELSRNGKLFYMWYLYSNTHITLKQKNGMWDYLNNYISIDDFYSYYRN